MSSIKEILEDIYPISTLYTDTLQRKPHRPFCGICSEVIRLDFVATDEAWELSLHINDRAGYVCISCFSKEMSEVLIGLTVLSSIHYLRLSNY